MSSLGYDLCALCGRVVRISDMNGNASDINRVESFLVKYRETCICELSHLVVSDLIDRERILNDGRVNCKYVVDVSPVLVNVGINGTCEDGARDIGASSRCTVPWNT